MVYLWPPDDADPAAHEVVAPRLATLLVVNGEEARPVRGLTIRGIDFRHARLPDGGAGFGAPGAAIQFNHVEDCVIERCRFERLGSNAIQAGPHVRRLTIRGCEVGDTGGGGISLRGSAGLPPFSATGNVIDDCTVHHAGAIYWHSSGIAIGAAERTRVAHNRVHHMPYIGISVGGGPRHTYYRGWPRPFPHLEALWREHGQGEPTIDKVKRFTPGHNTIEKNVVHHVMRVLDDGAAIYCHAGHHEAVLHNVVFAVESPMGMGLYFDDEQMDSTMRGNLVHRCPEDPSHEGHSAVVHLHHNGRHEVVNNVLVGGRQVLSVPNGYGGHRIERNVFVFAGEPNWKRLDPAPVLGEGDGRRQAGWSAGPSVVRQNLWSSTDGRGAAQRLLATWRERGYGEGSIAGDPMFTDPAADNYRLRDGSPAFGLGFEPLEIDDAGPRQNTML